jgi:hypothetical protein
MQYGIGEPAKAMVKSACHAADDDVCIFTGSGATGAIQKLIDILEIKSFLPETSCRFLFDHLTEHSNLLSKLFNIQRAIG